MKRGMNEEMEEELKQIVEKRMLVSVQHLVKMVQSEIRAAEYNQQNPHWKLKKRYYKGKVDAFERVLELLDIFSLGYKEKEFR